MTVRGGSKLDADAGSIFNADLQICSSANAVPVRKKMDINPNNILLIICSDLFICPLSNGVFNSIYGSCS